MVGAEDGEGARLAVVENREVALLEVFDRLAGRVPNRYVDLDEARVAVQNYATIALRMQGRRHQAKQQNPDCLRGNGSRQRLLLNGDHEPGSSFFSNRCYINAPIGSFVPELL
jgi:hypothetical protein